MIVQIVSVFDSISVTYGTPYYSVSTGSAIRGFCDEINRAADNNLLYQHPDDFSLAHLGTFDDADASFNLFNVPQTLMHGYNAKISKISNT